MRLNADNYQSVLDKKQLSHEYVQKATGLSKKTYLWILDNGFIENETLERVADAIGCPLGEIARPDYEGYSENVIEWVRDSPTATITLSQKRIITRVRKLSESHPEECRVLAENEDGSICARIPVSWVKINPSMSLSDEQRKERAEIMRKNRSECRL